ncbi:hypothetical protein PSACC_03108 [Paramicrosporidium saccamoebae]|uniref:Uncharacterized protein n=1 Tax=Paramicrosporidium saccamoebae TaxID=1246581 RepID=A0A2H9THG8_9FUNG|nr:hypothetical protein PSACC_03108 [Paramicrosporidium saccamoebae]
MQSPRYLTVPTDPLLLLSSPPCSPLPFDWHTWTEGPPTVADFDLEAAEGVVCLGDGRTVDLAARERSEFVVVRKGAIVSKAAAGRDDILDSAANTNIIATD